MRLPPYKTNRLLWFVLSLVWLLLSSGDVQDVFELFLGHSRVKILLRFEFIAPIIFSIIFGWLLQCAIVIVWSWKRKNPNPPH
jgi:hypothetical protein